MVFDSLCYLLQLYELDNDPKRKEFLDDLFTFMQKRGMELLVFLLCVQFRTYFLSMHPYFPDPQGM